MDIKNFTENSSNIMIEEWKLAKSILKENKKFKKYELSKHLIILYKDSYDCLKTPFSVHSSHHAQTWTVCPRIVLI